MCKKNKKYAKSQGFLEKIRSCSSIICTSRTLWFTVTLILLCLCSTSFAADFYSGNQYTFSSTYNENYIYQWSASAGNYQENDKNTFDWTAPEVKTPKEFSVSLLVIDRTCSCHSNSNTIVAVLPREENNLKIEPSSNSINSTSINDRIELPQILCNNTEGSIAAITIGNDIILDPASENLEKVTAPLNLTLDAVSITDSASLDSNIEATATETPLQVDTSQSDPNITSDISTLTFSDGTEVDVVFVQSSPVSSTTIVMLHGDNTERTEIISESDEKLKNTISLLNTTSISNSTFNQNNGPMNYTKSTEATPNNETNDHSNEVASEYSGDGNDPSNSKESPGTPPNQSIAESTASDAAGSSASPPLSVEASLDTERETLAVESSN